MMTFMYVAGIVLLIGGAYLAMSYFSKGFARRANYRMRVLEHLVKVERIPRSWVVDRKPMFLNRMGGGTQQISGRRHDENRASRAVLNRLRGYVRLAKRTSAFTDDRMRRETIDALSRLERRVTNEPLQELVGPDPRVRRHVILFDCGDTLIDEGTEVRDERGVVVRASLIPGAKKTVRELIRKGFTVGLVADGIRESFERMLKHHGIWPLLSAVAISDDLGVPKPDERMFKHALDQLGIAAEEYDSVIMVGNHLSRDIKGANRLGIISVWLDWAPRREKVPADEEERPNFTIKEPTQLLSLIERLESGQAYSE